MAYTGKDLGDGQPDRFFIITHHPAQAIAQGLDRLKHAAFQGRVIRRK
ncbi:MAG TPA: hypothetical protein VIH17_12975 [Candidatus Acidoferrales bacterium]